MQFHERVAPRAGDIVVRNTRVVAFSTTDLDAQLRARARIARPGGDKAGQ